MVCLSQKTKELWDQIDDNDKLFILGYTKSSSPSSSSSRPPGKSPFPPKQCCSFNLHEMSTYEFLQVHTHELEPDPAPDEAITENPPILDTGFKEEEHWGEIAEWNHPLMTLVIMNIASLSSTWYTPNAMMAMSLTTSSSNVSLIHKPLNLFKR
jgi:hypothetical protein